MSSSDASRRFRSLELDVADHCLLVIYSSESGGGSKKRIRLKEMTEGSDLQVLSEAIMRSCDVIPANKQGLLIDLLGELRQHDVRTQKGVIGTTAPPSRSDNTNTSTSTSTTTSSSTSNNNSSGGRGGGGGGGGGSAGRSNVSSTTANHRSSSSSSSSSSASASEGKDNNLEGFGRGGASSMMQAQALPTELDDVDKGVARVDNLDDYLEMLYEDDEKAKADGAKRILAIAQRVELLEHVVGNGTLMGALARVLRDDYRKSTTLSLLIMQIFFCVANFKDLHHHLIQARVGDMCVRIVELEHRRHTARTTDLERFMTLAALQSLGDTQKEHAFRTADADARAREDMEEEFASQRSKNKTVAASAAADGKVADDDNNANSGGMDGGRRRRAKGGGGGGGGGGGEEERKSSEGEGGQRDGDDKRAIKLKPLPEGVVDLEREKKKTHQSVRKSEALTYVCLHVLMNLAEDLDVERKMCKRGIVSLLTPLLERDNCVLLYLAVNFLRKLSIFEENKDAMVAQGAGTKLAGLLPAPKEVPVLMQAKSAVSAVKVDLLASVLHLMFNLTFDASMCQSFVSAGTLGKVGAMLRASPFRATGLKLLYRLSCDPDVRGQFADTGADAIQFTLSLVVKIPSPRLPLELTALAVNLAMNYSTCESLCKADAVNLLVQRLVKTNDSAVAKILRGLSQHTYSIQADSELKAHAMEDLKRELARTAATTQGASGAGGGKKKKKKKTKTTSSKQHGSSLAADGKSSEDASGGTKTMEESEYADIDQNNAAEPDPSSLLSAAVGPEPDVPIPYDYAYDGLWHPVIRDLVKVFKSADAPDLMIEMMGLFANLTPRDFPDSIPMSSLTEDAEFLASVVRHLNPAAASLPPEQGGGDDMLLEAVQVVSALALDPVSSPAIAASPIPRLLADVLSERAECHDTVLQTVTCVARLLHHHETRDVLVSSSKVPVRLAELLLHPIERIAAEADDCIYIMVEHDREFGATGLWSLLQSRRFSIYNREWLKATESSAVLGSSGRGNNTSGKSTSAQQQQKHQQQSSNTTQRPDAYVADEEEEEEETEDVNDGMISPNNPAEAVGSPLHHMGRHGEAVAFDVSYLYQQARGGPISRPLIADGLQPGFGAPYDYAEDVEDGGGDGSASGGGGGGAPRGLDDVGEEENEDDEDDEEEDDDMRAYMAQYMHSAQGGGLLAAQNTAGKGKGSVGPVHASSRIANFNNQFMVAPIAGKPAVNLSGIPT